MKYTTILRAFRKAKKVPMFWGSSGFGKTETVRAYAKEEGLELLTRNAVYLDPLNCWLPRFDETRGVVVDRPHEWVHKVLTTEVPLVLYLDELTRCRSVQIMNMLTELLLDRTFNGHPISEHVQIICATNLYEEDVALVEVPDAVMNRMFHFIFAPEASESAINMRTALGKEVLIQQPKILDVPGIPEFTLKGNPRAVDDIVDLWETGMLSESDLKLCCQVRIGKEKGAVCASTILDIAKKRNLVLPAKLTYEEFPRVAKADQGGMGIEVVNLLRVTIGDTDKKNAKAMRMVADYLIQYATAETCRAMQTAGFYFEYDANEIPKEADGTLVQNLLDGRKLAPGMPVQYYLLAKKKLSDGMVNNE